MLNPNCEYAANFVPTVALSHWKDTTKPYSAEAAVVSAAAQWISHFEPKPTSALASIPPITEDDVQLLIDCFYLPYKHGSRAMTYKKQFAELVSALIDSKASGLSSPDDPRVEAFAVATRQITTLFSKLTYIKNRDLLYSLYSYMWELKEEAYLLVAFVRHLVTHGPSVPFFERFHKASTFRGGLVADLQRSYTWDPQVGSVSLPAVRGASAYDHSSTFKIVAYEPKYEAGVHRVCLRTGDSGADGTHLFPEDPLILGRRYIGPYVAMEPELCFVLLNTSKPDTDPDHVCGYVAGAFDTTKFYKRMLDEWFPMMRSLYPSPPSTEGRSAWTPTQNLIFEFHNPALFFPDSLKYFHAHMHIDLVAEAQGKGLGTVLIERLLDALRRKNGRALHLGMSSVNHKAYKFYRKVGFVELAHVDDDAKEISADDPREHTLIMGKTL
jgi:GNAT superfamily N-acetyltransferase